MTKNDLIALRIAHHLASSLTPINHKKPLIMGFCGSGFDMPSGHLPILETNQPEAIQIRRILDHD